MKLKNNCVYDKCNVFYDFSLFFKSFKIELLTLINFLAEIYLEKMKVLFTSMSVISITNNHSFSNMTHDMHMLQILLLLVFKVKIKYSIKYSFVWTCREDGHFEFWAKTL